MHELLWTMIEAPVKRLLCTPLAATTVPLPKEGPVHDVQWSPAGDYFVTVAGFMPAKVRVQLKGASIDESTENDHALLCVSVRAAHGSKRAATNQAPVPPCPQATLWDANCKPIYDFGSGPYNLVRWNPFGRFLALAGFGNLPGGWVEGHVGLLAQGLG